VRSGLGRRHLNLANRTLGDYVKSGSPLMNNVLLSALAGFLWSSQYLCFLIASSIVSGYAGHLEALKLTGH
jgi:hypothetical protein